MEGRGHLEAEIDRVIQLRTDMKGVSGEGSRYPETSLGELRASKRK